MKTWPTPAWLNNLPPCATYKVNEPLADYTTIKVGGPAEVFATFENWEALQTFLKAKPSDVPFTAIGKGSNLVIREGGIPGVVAHIQTKGFDEVRVEGNTVYAQAGAATGTAARAAREAGLTGLEFFGGIPGSVGGALRMNAGAYGTETFDTLSKVWALDEKGTEHELPPSHFNPRYRHTDLPVGWVYKAGLWTLKPGDKESIRQRMREINHARSTTQPLHMPSSGSWFQNPTLTADGPLGKAGEKVNAWKVTDAAGCRGWKEGDAQVSEQHCNFFINLGNATATDLDTLSNRVEAEIKSKLGIVMEREVKFTGVS